MSENGTRDGVQVQAIAICCICVNAFIYICDKMSICERRRENCSNKQKTGVVVWIWDSTEYYYLLLRFYCILLIT